MEVNEGVKDKGKRVYKTYPYKNGENRLGKRMTYLLRYGAIESGLQVDPEGYVEISELLGTHLMRHNTEEEVLKEVENSISSRGRKRFELKITKNSTYIRAAYFRQFKRSAYHEGTSVPRLMESCLNTIATNIKNYDLEEFCDEHLLTSLIHKLKRQKKLNNTAMRNILGPTIEHLDLEGVYITEATIKLIASRCPDLKFLNLKDSGFVMTDHLLHMLLRKLPKLKVLNLTNCNHLTDNSLRNLLKHNPNLEYLNICDLQLITQEAIVDFLALVPSLVHLDIYYNRNIKEDMLGTIEEISRQRNISVELKKLTKSDVAPNDALRSWSKFRMAVR